MDNYILKRTETAVEFTCSHCNRKKKSKNIATCGDLAICNGCYGLLLSKNLITKV